MSIPTSALAAVQTFQASGLDYLQNINCLINTANTKFQNFESFNGQLGSTVGYSTPPQTRAVDSLVISDTDWQGIDQTVHQLTVDKEIAVPVKFSDQDYLFQAEHFIDDFHMASTAELSARMERRIWETTVASNTYKSYFNITNNLVTPLTSYKEIAQLVSDFKSQGAPQGNYKIYLPNNVVPELVQESLNNFTLKRNEASANSWELGSWQGVDFYESNCIPQHDSGTIGNDGETMTIVSISADGKTITANGVTATTATLSQNDIVYFLDVEGQPNVRPLSFYGHFAVDDQVTRRVTTAAVADGTGQIVFSIDPPLDSGNTATANINVDINAGMQLKAVPSHTTALLTSSNALFVAMPRLPDMSPFASHSQYDKDTGVSYRVSYGSFLGQGFQGFVVDGIYGASMAPDYVKRICLPVL